MHFETTKEISEFCTSGFTVCPFTSQPEYFGKWKTSKENLSLVLRHVDSSKNIERTLLVSAFCGEETTGNAVKRVNN